jgi:chorismate dehydratase
MKIYKVGVVSYLNSKPFLEGLLHSPVIQLMHLQVLPPAVIAELLIKGDIDLGLVPVKVIHQLPKAIVNTNYCIGSTDYVHSVCLFSNTSIDKCHTVILDSESRTSVALAKVLLRDYFKHQVSFIQSHQGYESELCDGVAGLIIGDRAFKWHGHYRYVYDLGHYWRLLTGLPFVFAAWVSNTELEKDFAKRFNDALASGIDSLNTWLPAFQSLYPDMSLREYFTQNISYQLDADKQKALELFLQLSSTL